MDRLREVSDVARNQVELLESLKSEEHSEVEGLREALADLQSRSDDAALVGRLHRQIIALQVSVEKEAIQAF